MFIDLTDNNVVFNNSFKWCYVKGKHSSSTVILYSVSKSEYKIFWVIFQMNLIYDKLQRKRIDCLYIKSKYLYE